jgi:hypothetical protein
MGLQRKIKKYLLPYSSKSLIFFFQMPKIRIYLFVFLIMMAFEVPRKLYGTRTVIGGSTILCDCM